MKILENSITRKLLWLNVFILGTSSGAIILKNSALPDLVPLFYSRPWGAEQLAAKNFLWLIPTASLITLIINNILNTILLKKEEEFLAILLSVFSLVFSIIGAITLVNIIVLVT